MDALGSLTASSRGLHRVIRDVDHVFSLEQWNASQEVLSEGSNDFSERPVPKICFRVNNWPDHALSPQATKWHAHAGPSKLVSSVSIAIVENPAVVCRVPIRASC